MELVQTSRQQYNSFEIELSEIGYKHTEGKQNTYPDQKNEIIWRNTESCSYARIEHTSFEDKDGSNNVNKEVTTKTYSITPKWSKKLQETNASNSPRGRVSRGSELEDETGLTIIDAMWGIFGQPWEKFASENAVLSKDSKSGLYTLKGQAFPDGTTITVTIDPSKNFLPIKYEFNRPNGELAIKCECSDFKKTEDGLWVPYQYIFTDEVNGYTSIHKLKNVKVNIDISKDMLDFSFPPGTIINDQIANLKYVVDGPQEDYDMLDFDTSEIKQSVESTNLDMVTINDIKTPK
ncbi:hypothetical protein KAR91_00210, partial [Candidatus Pacearchaeota archaeon]|nr:hypothetical protein [Candidatus Pacearchaeota archaeon]